MSSTKSPKNENIQYQCQTKLLINNEFTEASDKSTIAVVKPNNGVMICEVSSANECDVDAAVMAARKAFASGPWPTMSALERRSLILNLAALIDLRKDELATLDSLNTGKNRSYCLETDVLNSVKSLTYYARLEVLHTQYTHVK
jgi:acyl-CoA reductase-like NAD-dependent aldehyde dehydrogenase